MNIDNFRKVELIPIRTNRQARQFTEDNTTVESLLRDRSCSKCWAKKSNSDKLLSRLSKINTASLSTAKQQIKVRIFDNLTVDLVYIDMTTDFNQNKWLGQELTDTLIYFDEKTKPNALLAVFDCICAGYTLYLAYSAEEISGYFKNHILIPRLKKISEKSVNDYDEMIPQQSLGLNADKIIRQLEKAKLITHLIGLRGTGKSTLLGLYINQLVSQGMTQIALISQYKTSSNNTLKVLNDVSRETIHYYSPAELRKNIAKYRVILIDESSSLAKQFIQMVIAHAKKHQKKVILATTLEGYEGTGQSYRLNYITNNEETVISLTETLRFAKNDPLHCLVQQFCQPTTKKWYPISNLEHKPSRRISLANGEYIFNTAELRENNLTESCFALLKKAHYKTTPNDLERFYNEPAVFALSFIEGNLVAVAYALPEILDKKINLSDIFYGTRRVKNALTQQSLIYAYGENQQLAAKRILRISRIATVEKYQKKGIASRLMTQLAAYGKQKNYDLLSTSFTLTEKTLSFWSSLAFQPVRIGINKNKWHNEYALLMLYDLAANQRLIISLFHKYYRHLIYYKKIYHMSESGKKLYSISDTNNNLIENNLITSAENLSINLHHQIDSVLNGHRDIHWLLPLLNEYYQKDKKKLALLSPILTGTNIKKSHLADAKWLLQNINIM